MLATPNTGAGVVVAGIVFGFGTANTPSCGPCFGAPATTAPSIEAAGVPTGATIDQVEPIMVATTSTAQPVVRLVRDTRIAVTTKRNGLADQVQVGVEAVAADAIADHPMAGGGNRYVHHTNAL